MVVTAIPASKGKLLTLLQNQETALRSCPGLHLGPAAGGMAAPCSPAEQL